MTSRPYKIAGSTRLSDGEIHSYVGKAVEVAGNSKCWQRRVYSNGQVVILKGERIVTRMPPAISKALV